MEFIKEFLDEGRSRIKSNVFASVVFAFVVLNWQPLFFVAFEKVDSVSKFEYFDKNTYWYTLYLLPLLIGGVLAIGLPFINNLAHKAVSGTISATRTRDDEHAHQRLKKKNEWEEERLRERALYAENLISEAQIDQEIDDKIQDPKKRKEIKSKLGEREANILQNQQAKLRGRYSQLQQQLDRVSDELIVKKDEYRKRTENDRFLIGGDKSFRQLRNMEREDINRLLSSKSQLELDVEEVKSQLSKL